jgi:hypothetical protein
VGIHAVSALNDAIAKMREALEHVSECERLAAIARDDAPLWWAAYDGNTLLAVKEEQQQLPQAFPRPYEYVRVRIVREP